LNRAIEALQGTAKPPGHALKNHTPTPEPITVARKKRHVSAAARQKMAAGQRKRWAAIKAAK